MKKDHLMKNFRIRKTAALLLCAVFVFASLPVYAHTDNGRGKTVKVGWYESSFNTREDNGRRSGYAYEYQMKLAAYTGWKYEYVEGSWSDLMEMLKNGEIDLMSDVSYTDERAEQMLFPTLPMGTEEYYIFTAPGNDEIRADDYSTLNGKRIGVNKGSIQVDYFHEWARQQGVDATLLELTGEEAESLEMLQKGKLDAYITPDSFGDPEYLVPVCKIGSSDFFFAVNKDRKDLLNDLNIALSNIQDENRYYNQQMSEKYLIRSGVNAFLTSDESKWLEKHGPIRVGYQDNYMAFCAKDKETGELTGALKDYLEYASGSLQNAHIDFEPVAYPTVADAMEAMDKGEVDCVFPSNLGGYDGETNDIVMTPSLMRTDVFAVVRNSDARTFGEKNHVIVAVNEGNPNYDAFLLDNFPDWRTVYYPDTSKCLRAVADGVADCVLISSFRYNNIARECDRYNLTTIDTGVGVDYRFAVKSGNTELYSILARVTGLVPSSTINSVLSYYITEDAKSTFRDFFMENMEIFTLVMLLLMAVVLALMFRSRRAERRANELISATEHDNLTGLYNRDFFLEYVNRMHNENPNQAMDAVVCNIEQFHSVNAVSGRDFGDFVLRSLGSELKAIASERDGIAGRFGADRFDLYCRHTDDHQAIYDRLQSVLDEMAHTSNMRLRMGVMRSQPDIDAVQMFDMARIACNMIRGDFKEHLVVFDDEVREREEYEQRLLSDLQRALDSFEFEVYYQPKYDILVEPAKLVSAEALIRWRHPELGIIPPDDFIPLFERSGKISDVDKFVWNEAARQIVRWRELYGVTIPVSVNLSRVDVFDPALEETLDEIIKFNGLDHDLLKLEVTESAYTENSEQVIKVVSSLRRKGYVIEMDDFGTGYSSLSMLSEMPVDILKLDRNFVRNIDHSEKDAQLVALILDISKELDIPVVAEGVETEAQLQMLRKLGCAIAQGYYFSRPLNVAEFENKILKESIKEDK